METLVTSGAAARNVRSAPPPVIEPARVEPAIEPVARPSPPFQSSKLQQLLDRAVQAEIDKRQQDELERLGHLAKFD